MRIYGQWTRAIEITPNKMKKNQRRKNVMILNYEICYYLPQGYPRESCAKLPALENIPSTFQRRSSIHTHCKDLCNRIPVQNNFHRIISDLKKNKHTNRD